jgi:glycosyltransferase EpsE
MTHIQEKITVIMSAFNDEKFIKKSVESILKQTYKNFTFKIIDDCSSDRTKQILYQLKNQDPRIQLFCNSKNLGLTKNLNFLLKNCNTRYVARMDSDDICLPNRFEFQMQKIKSSNLDILGSNCYYLYENKRKTKSNLPIKKENIYKSLCYFNPIIHSSVIFDKNKILKIGNYNIKYQKCQDLDLWLRSKKKNLIISNCKKPLIIHRVKDKKDLIIIYYTFLILINNLFKTISVKSAITLFSLSLGSIIVDNFKRISK